VGLLPGAMAGCYIRQSQHQELLTPPGVPASSSEGYANGVINRSDTCENTLGRNAALVRNTFCLSFGYQIGWLLINSRWGFRAF
jgi:hypothetical protein